jgi:nicotinamidase-related amidase
MKEKIMSQALLIIDVQNDYFAGGKCELHNPLVALENIEKLLNHFRNAKKPIIHVQHINVKEGATFFVPNTEGVLIHKNLTPQSNETLIIKHAPNSFYETDLLQTLKQNAISDLVICGMMTHICIDTTTRACKDFGFNVTLIDDACATKNLSYDGKIIPAETVHQTFMASLNGMFANVRKTDEFLQ